MIKAITAITMIVSTFAIAACTTTADTDAAYTSRVCAEVCIDHGAPVPDMTAGQTLNIVIQHDEHARQLCEDMGGIPEHVGAVTICHSVDF